MTITTTMTMQTFISRLLTLIVVLTMTAFSATAQSYRQLWDATARAFDNDLPKTALANVRTIRAKAAADGDRPQLLRALCTEWVVSREISRDSTAAVTAEIRGALAEADTSGRQAEAALWQNALGQLTGSDSLLIASVAHPDILAAARVADFLPAFVTGRDSRWMHDDLLSVLADVVLSRRPYYWADGPDRITDTVRRNLYDTVRKIYEGQGNAEALLLVDFRAATDYGLLDSRDDAVVGDLISRIRALSPKMKGTPAVKAMGDWVARAEQPMVTVSWHSDGGFASLTAARVDITTRNVANVALRLHLVKGLKAEDISDDSAEMRSRLLKSRRAVPVATYRQPLAPVAAHKEQKTAIDLTLPEAGIYIVELVADGKVRATEWLYVSDVVPLFFHTASEKGSATRLVLVDSRSGQPLTGSVRVQPVTGSVRGKSVAESVRGEFRSLSPAADGSFDVTDFDYDDAIFVSSGSDAYHPAVSLRYNPRGFFVGNHQEACGRLYTDRAIYRPGQKVQFAGLVYSRDNDSYTAQEGWTGKVVLQNAERKDIAEMSVTADAFGQFDGSFDLPEAVVPGRFSLVLRGNGVRHTAYVQVEEYKRPTFRVVFDSNDGRRQWQVGDSIVVSGRVETFGGIGIGETAVRLTTRRHQWLWRSSGEDVVLADTLTTDADGRFSTAFVADSDGIYVVDADVTASNGESVSARRNFYIGHRAAEAVAEEATRDWFRAVCNDARSEAHVHVDATLFAGVTDEKPLHLFCDIVTTSGGIVSSHRMTVADSLDFTLRWQESYGDGATLFLAVVREGQLQTRQVSVQRPCPDKRLLLSWSTFRDRLQPGEDETWTLSVRYPDGRPADAMVMARLYDASLDAFTTSPWAFHLPFDRTLPRVGGYSDGIYNNPLYYVRALRESRSCEFTKWQPTMFSYFSAMVHRKNRTETGQLYYSFAAPMAQKVTSNVGLREIVALGAMADSADEMVEEESAEESAEAAATAEALAAPVRDNFDETAFFLPALRTDAEGRATITFTLPESLTSWHFSAIAHDGAMNYGVLHDTIAARKMLTAEVAAPRFLREGDTTALPVTVRNLTEVALSIDVTIVLTDAATGKVVGQRRQTLKLAGGKAETLSHPLTASKDVKVRVVARAQTGEEVFSDGEERLIPVLDGREAVTTTLPFSATEAGTIALDLAPLHLDRLMAADPHCRPTLTVEYCANPLWNVVGVLPALLEGEAYSATEWATRLYAVEIAAFLSPLHPSTLTLQPSTFNAQRYRALDNLKAFQRGDGGFCWYRGFNSSLWITTDVAILLARQQKMTGSRVASDVLDRAVCYLEGAVAEVVREMRRTDASISEPLLRYLYVRHLLGLAPDKDSEFLLARAARENKDLTMYGKAAVAQILAKSHPQASALALESLIEHTVISPEMGRYFDTDRALGGWASYKIPTQTMAIEALSNLSPLTPNLSSLPLEDEMRLWLLQSKRTQQWESSRATADAVYALLAREVAAGTTAADLSPADYSRRTLTADEAARALKRHSYNIIKEKDGLSWGALYADYSLPVELVEASSAGFTLSRRWEVWRGGRWQQVEGSVKVGERLRQTFTLVAERDYDFVSLEASRPACAESRQPLSGMAWLGGTPCYRMVRDSRNDYHFEHLSKGVHTFTEELVVDREGTFATGTARVTCSFAPEFGAYAPSTRVFAISE